MQHYICTGGCGGEASAPGVCQAEGCKKEGEELIECGCVDNKHAGTEGKEEVAPE